MKATVIRPWRAMTGSRRRTSQPPNNLRMAEIAKLAGVSESTVARALKDSPLIAATTRVRTAGSPKRPAMRSTRSPSACGRGNDGHQHDRTESTNRIGATDRKRRPSGLGAITFA